MNICMTVVFWSKFFINQETHFQNLFLKIFFRLENTAFIQGLEKLIKISINPGNSEARNLNYSFIFPHLPNNCKCLKYPYRISRCYFWNIDLWIRNKCKLTCPGYWQTQHIFFLPRARAFKKMAVMANVEKKTSHTICKPIYR